MLSLFECSCFLDVLTIIVSWMLWLFDCDVVGCNNTSCLYHTPHACFFKCPPIDTLPHPSGVDARIVDRAAERLT